MMMPHQTKVTEQQVLLHCHQLSQQQLLLLNAEGKLAMALSGQNQLVGAGHDGSVTSSKPIGRATVFISNGSSCSNGDEQTCQSRRHDNSSHMSTTDVSPPEVVCTQTVAAVAARQQKQQLDSAATTTATCHRRQHHHQHVPSTSISSPFICSSSSLPDGYARVAKCLLSTGSTEVDEHRLRTTCSQLEPCTFYIAELTSTDAKNWLRSAATGKFLVRDSTHSSYLYTLSIKTARGVTSIRIGYGPDGFRLDSDADQARLMPAFETVLALVWNYVTESHPTSSSGSHKAVSGSNPGTVSRTRSGTAPSSSLSSRSSCIFLDRSGHKGVPVVLTEPCHGRVTTLRHLCRVTINRRLGGRSPDRLCLIPSLKDFMKQYPFSI
jgi:hypothetical protein